MKAIAAAFVATVLLTLATQPAAAQTSDEVRALMAEIEALKEGQRQMREDLAAIRRIFEQAAQRRSGARAGGEIEPVELSVGDSAVLGDAAAPVTLVEYSDYQCPYCRRHASRVKPKLIESYVQTGKLRYVVREFPIESLHPQAPMASQAALCAKEQDAYWGMHDRIFADPKRVSPADFEAHAAALGLDVAAFTECLREQRYAAQIRRDQQEGAQLGIRGTPTFLLGTTDPADPSRVTATRMIRGARPLAVFRETVEKRMEEASTAVPGKS